MTFLPSNSWWHVLRWMTFWEGVMTFTVFFGSCPVQCELTGPGLPRPVTLNEMRARPNSTPTDCFHHYSSYFTSESLFVSPRWVLNTHTVSTQTDGRACKDKTSMFFGYISKAFFGCLYIMSPLSSGKYMYLSMLEPHILLSKT